MTKKQQEAYSSELEWLIVAGASACGAKGFSIAPFTSRGNDFESGITDAKFGLGPKRVSSVTRARRLLKAWRTMPASEQEVAISRYLMPPIGAPTAERDKTRLFLAEWPGLHGEMGDLSGVCLLLAFRRDGSLERFTAQYREAAGANAERKRKFWDGWRKKASRANAEMHASWILSLADQEAA